MLFCIGATEDAASGRAARRGGTDLFRQTLLDLQRSDTGLVSNPCVLYVLTPGQSGIGETADFGRTRAPAASPSSSFASCPREVMRSFLKTLRR